MSALSDARARVAELQNNVARARDLVIQLDTALKQVKQRISLIDLLTISIPLTGLIGLLLNASRPSIAPLRRRKLELVRPLPTPDADDSHEVAP